MAFKSALMAVACLSVVGAVAGMALGVGGRAAPRPVPGTGTAPATVPAAKNVTIKRQVLAENQTIAKLKGIAYQRCNGMTSLCPDNCGNSGDFATFEIVAYVKYNKLGEYGDDQAKTYSFQVNDNHKVLKITKEYSDAVRALKPGDYVLLNWNHEYVTREEDGTSASGPERPLTKVQTISKEEADKLAAATQPK
jgi:hypothetical protein